MPPRNVVVVLRTVVGMTGMGMVVEQAATPSALPVRCSVGAREAMARAATTRPATKRRGQRVVMAKWKAPRAWL
jgi:hypothetical protein